MHPSSINTRLFDLPLLLFSCFSHFCKHSLAVDGPELIVSAVCVSGKRHQLHSSHGTLDEPLDCVMFVYLACLPPRLLMCAGVWLAVLATMLG